MKAVKTVSMPEAPHVRAVETEDTVFVNEDYAYNDAVCYGRYCEFDSEPSDEEVTSALAQLFVDMHCVLRAYPNIESCKIIKKLPSYEVSTPRWTVAIKVVVSGEIDAATREDIRLGQSVPARYIYPRRIEKDSQS